MRTETDEIRDNLKYLTLLARDYPSQAAAASEIISTQALLKLPKGTEHFMSDLHGENEAFVHILNSASGVILGGAARFELGQLFGGIVDQGGKLGTGCLRHGIAQHGIQDRKSTRLNSSHVNRSRMPSSA